MEEYDQQCMIASLKLFKLIKMNPEITGDVWISQYLKYIMRLYHQNGISFEETKADLIGGINFHKYMFEDVCECEKKGDGSL
jgi:hypothetical protein